MLYVPSPYSSGTADVSVCEQDNYSVSTPPSPPCGLATSDSYNNIETSDYSVLHESPPLTPRQLLDSDPETQLLDQPTATTTTRDDDEEDELFFLGQLKNNPMAMTTLTHPQQQQQHEEQRQEHEQQEQLEANGDYLLYDHGFEESDYQQYQHQHHHHHHHSDQGSYIFEPFDKSLYSTPSITDDDFETANRAFHATINKFSRQNYPDHRKRTPYNFLENWHLHSMYSKSQQILLGIPHVRPTVLLSGDDFMFTPPLLQQEEEEDYMDDHQTDHQLGYLDQSMQMEWIDDGQMFEDDAEILDDGIVIMSAPDPPLMMTPSTTPSPLPPPSTSPVLNENAWMRNHLDFPSQHYHHLDYTNDHTNEEEEENIDDDDLQQQQQQQQQQQEEEQLQQQDNTSAATKSMISTLDRDPIYFASGLTSEILHWYRTSDRGRPPSTIMENRDDGEEEEKDIDEQVSVDDSINNNSIHDNNDMETHQSSTSTTTTATATISTHSDEKQTTIVNTHGSLSPTSYQSLADIVPPSSTFSQSCRSTPQELPPPQQQYGATHDRQQQQQQQQQLQQHTPSHRGMTNQFVVTSDLVLTTASNYRLENKNSTMSFISCMIQIWKILFLTAELMLASLWGQQPPMMVMTTTSTKFGSRKNATKPPILPF